MQQAESARTRWQLRRSTERSPADLCHSQETSADHLELRYAPLYLLRTGSGGLAPSFTRIRLLQPPPVIQRLPQDELNLSIQTSKVVIRPTPHFIKKLGVDADQE